MSTETDVSELEWGEVMQRIHDEVGCAEYHALQNAFRFWVLCGIAGPIVALILGVILGGLAF